MNNSRNGADATPKAAALEERLESWKKIASYLKRDVRTVQRWERREGMPVHRHLHDKGGSVFAYRAELDGWWEGRRALLESDSVKSGAEGGSLRPIEWLRRHARDPVYTTVLLTSLCALMFAGVLAWRATQHDYFWRNPLANARFTRIADLGTGQAAAISRDGRLVAILASRNDQTDIWFGEADRDVYRNVTQGGLRGLSVTNPVLRTVSISPDSSLVSVWTRRSDGSQAGDVGLLAVATTGGPLRPYMPGAAEVDWSHDGKWLVYHTTAPGDPLFVTASAGGGQARRIYVAPGGVHCHFPLWSPDDAYVYFVRGVPASGEWDIWRLRPSGGVLERITNQSAQISYPVFLDRRTMLYLATDESGAGPWVYAVDVERRVPHRVSSGLESYKSLAASVDGRRLVATFANVRTSLWRLRLGDGSGAGEPAAGLTLIDTDGRAPQAGPDSIIYVASRGGRPGIWRRGAAGTRELWRSAQARILGRPALTADGRRIAFTVEDPSRKTRLYVMDSDGSHVQMVMDSLALRGDPAWSLDGQSLVSGVMQNGEPRLTRIFLRTESPLTLVSDYSVDPVRSPDGQFLVYYGADIGTSVPVRAAAADGRPYPLPALLLPRGSRVAFGRDARTLLVLRVDANHMTLLQVDLSTGGQRTLRELPAGFDTRYFAVVPGGEEIILDRVEDNSDVALIDRASEGV